MRSFVISIRLYTCESVMLEKRAWDKMLQKAVKYFLQGPYNKRRGSQKDPNSHWRIWWTPDPGQEMEAKMVWPRLKLFWFSKDDAAGIVIGKRKGRQTKMWEENRLLVVLGLTALWDSISVYIGPCVVGWCNGAG